MMDKAEAFDRMLQFVYQIAEGRTAECGNYASTAQKIVRDLESDEEVKNEGRW